MLIVQGLSVCVEKSQFHMLMKSTVILTNSQICYVRLRGHMILYFVQVTGADSMCVCFHGNPYQNGDDLPSITI